MKKITPALLFLLSLSSLSFANPRIFSEANPKAGLSAPLEKEYDLGSTLSLPSYAFETSKGFVSVDPLIQFPNGNLFADKEVTLDQYGKYTLKYAWEDEGKMLTHEESFLVRQDLFRFSKPTSSFTTTVPDYALAYTSARGSYISLAKGDTLELEKTIDITDLSADAPLIQGFITPKESGNKDFTQMYITFTDSENPNIYLQFFVTNPTNEAWAGISYWRAGGNGQTLTGWNTESGTGKPDTSYGTKVTLPFDNKRASSAYNYELIDPSRNAFSLSFDPKTFNVYYDKTMIADLDSASMFSSTWNGFESSKVRLSITAASYQGTNAMFCLTDIHGIDLSQEKVLDEEGPTIEVETETLPEGIKGRGYPIPQAKAFDGEEEKEVKASVYYNYQSNDPISLPIKDNAFLPTQDGYYALVYASLDIYGNESKKILWVHVGGKVYTISGSLPEGIEDSYPVGSIISIPEVKDLKGGTGKLITKVTLKKDSLEVEEKENSFQPLETGKYTLTYLVEDYVGQKFTLSKEIQIVDNPNPVFSHVESLMDSFMSGQSYEIPKVYAYTFPEGKAKEVLCDLKITDKNGETDYQGKDKFTPVMETNGDSIHMDFSYDGKTVYKTDKPCIIPYVQGKLQIQNYFLGENYEMNPGNSGLEIKLTNEKEASLSFYSKLIADKFSAKFYLSEQMPEEMEVILTDSENEEEKVTGKITFDSLSNTMHILLDGENHTLDYPNELFTYSYSEGSFHLENGSFVIHRYDSGKRFNGFHSNFVHIALKLKGKTGDSIYLQNLNDNPFSSTDRDRTDCEYLVNGDYGGEYKLHDIYTLKHLLYNDVLSPKADCILDVTSPSGKTVKSITGEELSSYHQNKDIQISLEEYGSYSINYTLDDSSDLTTRSNVSYFSYLINVREVEPPTIEIGDYESKVKVGDTIVFPQIQVHDDISKEENLTVIYKITNPVGREWILPEGSQGIKATYEGTYRLTILAFDEEGNYSSAEVLFQAERN